VRVGIGHTNQRQRTSLMLAIERRGIIHIKAAGGSVVRIVEPETYMEGVGRLQIHVRVETENLIQQNSSDADGGLALIVRFDIGLIPGQTKTPVVGHEVRVGVALSIQEGGALDGEQVKG